LVNAASRGTPRQSSTAYHNQHNVDMDLTSGPPPHGHSKNSKNTCGRDTSLHDFVRWSLLRCRTRNLVFLIATLKDPFLLWTPRSRRNHVQPSIVRATVFPDSIAEGIFFKGNPMFLALAYMVKDQTRHVAPSNCFRLSNDMPQANR
jgi:hypothetical protein